MIRSRALSITFTLSNPTSATHGGRRRMAVLAGFAFATVLLIMTVGPATPVLARTLASIKDSGAITLCAHPNALPFASKDGERHGFQVEMAGALARRLGVALTREWVITRY